MENRSSNEMTRYNYISSEIDSAYHDVSVRLGLSDSAMLILYTVCEHGGECLLSDVMRLSGISKQTVNSSLRKLEKDGIIRLEAAGGKKKKTILTASGREVAENTVMRVIRIENEIFESWTEEERRFYTELTQRYLTEFKEKTKGLKR